MRGVSPVWIVPIVAIVIAGWLAVKAHMEKGTTIQITFTSATDILARQTTVKLKDLTVGNVTRVRLSDDLSSVIVTAELDASVSAHLSENTRFWVVTPRVSATEISNLGTLINGVYIQMDPGEKGEFNTKFRGLDEPPLIKSDVPGKQFVFQSEVLGSLGIGSPIYFRQISVGEITGYKLAENNEHVDINFFIKAPFDTLIETNTRFWNVSGVNVSVTAEGVKANMASIASLLSGGVEFEHVASFGQSQPAPEGHRFYLYKSKDSVEQGAFSHRYHYLAKFSSSIKGLTVDAPVEFRGIKVGEVESIQLVSADNIDDSLHVYFSIEPERFNRDIELSRAGTDDQIEHMIQQGLRAQMKSGSLITGSKYIDLGYTGSPLSGYTMVRHDRYSVVPTIEEDSIDNIVAQVGDLLAKINAIPIAEIGADLSGSMASLNKLITDLEQKNTAGKVEDILVSADNSLKELNKTMKDIDAMVSPDSEFKHELTETLKGVGSAVKSLDRFLDELNRHPDSLIFGAEKDK